MCGATGKVLWQTTENMYFAFSPFGAMRFVPGGPVHLVGHSGGCFRWIRPGSNTVSSGVFGSFSVPYDRGCFGCIVPNLGLGYQAQRVISLAYLYYDDVYCFTSTPASVAQAAWKTYMPGALLAIGGDVHPNAGYEVLVSTVYGELYCLSAETGSNLWKMEFPSAVMDMLIGNCDGDADNELVLSFMDGTVGMYDRAQTADVEVRAQDLWMNEPTPGVFNSYYFMVKVYNRGGTNTGPFTVRFDDNWSGVRPQFFDPYVGERGFSEVFVSDIPAGGMVVVTSLYDQTSVAGGSVLYWRPDEGEVMHVIRVSADSSNVVVEAQEGNNVASNGWYVYGYPDFAVVRVWSEPRPAVGGVGLTNVIKVLVANLNSNGLPAYVTARVRYDVRSGSGASAWVVGGVIGEQGMQVHSGGTTEYRFGWVAP
ncbi:MAG: hypothetical protein N2595_03140, partial [bacterium]|nr:hypothetical protein [bacterium]